MQRKMTYMSPPQELIEGPLTTEELAALGGRVIAEASILTSMGVFVADVAWMSYAFSRAHGFETPYTKAPELCVEIVSPANSVKEMNEKRDAYLAAGARGTGRSNRRHTPSI
jgi:Uma2 family endonuclease